MNNSFRKYIKWVYLIFGTSFVVLAVITIVFLFSTSKTIYANARSSLDPWDDVYFLGVLFSVFCGTGLIWLSTLVWASLGCIYKYKQKFVIAVFSFMTITCLTSIGLLYSSFRLGRDRLIVEKADNLIFIENDLIAKIEEYKKDKGELPESLLDLDFQDGYKVVQNHEEKKIGYSKLSSEQYRITFYEGWYYHEWYNDEKVWRMLND